VAPANERADRGRGRVEDVDAVFLDHAPEAILAWMVRGAFVHERGRAVTEWAVDDVAVARDPADVGRAPVGVVLLEIEHPLVRERDAEQVAGRCMQNTLGLSGRAGGVEDVEGMLAVERLGGANG